MAQSCGAEDYAWTAEATTVTLIREVRTSVRVAQLGLMSGSVRGQNQVLVGVTTVATPTN